MKVDRSQNQIIFTPNGARTMEILDCSVPTAAAYIKKLHEELKVIIPAEGQGKGKYRYR